MQRAIRHAAFLITAMMVLAVVGAWGGSGALACQSHHAFSAAVQDAAPQEHAGHHSAGEATTQPVGGALSGPAVPVGILSHDTPHLTHILCPQISGLDCCSTCGLLGPGVAIITRDYAAVAAWLPDQIASGVTALATLDLLDTAALDAARSSRVLPKALSASQQLSALETSRRLRI